MIERKQPSGIGYLTTRFPQLRDKVQRYEILQGAKVIRGQRGFVTVINRQFQYVIDDKPQHSYFFDPTISSQLTGVSIVKMHGKPVYRSRIKIDGRKASLGCYGSAFRAGEVVKEAQRQLNAGLVVSKASVLKALTNRLYRAAQTGNKITT